MRTKGIFGLSAVCFATIVSITSACNDINSRKEARPTPRQELRADEPRNEEPLRYELKDFKRGEIAGLALLDKKSGRVWVLKAIRDANGKEERDEFREVDVERLYGDRAILEAQAQWWERLSPEERLRIKYGIGPEAQRAKDLLKQEFKLK